MRTLVELKELRKSVSDEQIISKFNQSSIHISKVETKGRENGIICVINRNYPTFFPNYFSAYLTYNDLNLI